MKPFQSLLFYSCCLLFIGLSTLGRGAGLTTATSLSISLSPASATYTVGQSVTVMVTGGTADRNYALSLYDGNPTDQSSNAVNEFDVILNNEATDHNNITWQSGQTSAWFIVRFTAAGSNRVFDLGNADNNEFVDTDLAGFTVLIKPTLKVTYSPSSESYTVGQSLTLTIAGGIAGEKYMPLLFDGPASLTTSTDISEHLNNFGNSQGTGNTVTWQANTVTEQFYLRFDGGAGTGRVLEVTNLDFSHTNDSPALLIVCPTVSILAAPSLSIASGGSVTLTASGATSYTWSNGVESTSMVLSGLTSDTTLSVTGTTGSCSATATATVSISATQTTPVISASLLTLSTTVCMGGTAPEQSFTVSGSNLSNAPGNSLFLVAPPGFEILGLDGYTSEFGLPISDDGLVPPTTILIRPLSTATPGSLSGSVTLTSAGATSQQVAVSVLVNVPTVSISPSTTTISGGQSVTLTASGADSYVWSTSDTGNQLVKSPAQTTIYSVTGTSNGCTGTASATVTADCGEPLQADAASVVQTTILGPDNCAIILQGTGYGTGFTITGPDGYVFSSVYRKPGNYTINGLKVTQPGIYTLKVSYSDACGRSSSDTMTYVVTGTACK